MQLSFTQERMWFFEQLEPGTPFNIVSRAYSLTGLLDMDVLQKSIDEILCRHEALRTTIQAVDGKTFQMIAPHLALELPVIDLRHIPNGEREDHARKFASEESLRPFVLQKGPLIRISLLKLEEEEHMIIASIHRIISDCWSMGIFFRELSVLYEAFSMGKDPSLPELPVQHADFVHWQRQRFQEKLFEDQISYWREQLEGDPHELKLPFDHLPKSDDRYGGARQYLLLSENHAESLKALSRQEGVTLFITLLSAFKVLLYRYTGQEDILVGSQFANRYRPEIQGLIGPFANTLVIRTSLSGGINFRTLLGRLREVVFGAVGHQDLPIEKLVAELNNEREFIRKPPFQVMFSMRNFPSYPIVLPGLIMKEFDIEFEFAKLDLTVDITEKDKGIRCLFAYNSEKFRYDTIRRLVEQFRILLEAVMSDPEQELATLRLTSDGKLDSETFTILEKQSSKVQKTYIAPRDPTEVWLINIWEELLSVKPIGVTDNFFELGGTSLKAMQLFARIEEISGKNIPPTVLFHAQTIEQLSKIVTQEGGIAPSDALVSIQPDGSKPPFFCVPAHLGNTIRFMDLSNYLGSDQPFYALQFSSLDGNQPSHYRGIEHMAADFINEIRTVQPDGPYYLGGFCFGGKVAFEMARQLRGQGEKVAFLALVNAYAPNFPEYIRHYNLLPFEIYRYVQKVIGRLGIILELKPQDRFPYIFEKLRNGIEIIVDKIKEVNERIFPGVAVDTEHPLSGELRVIREANQRVMDDYLAKPYPGKVTLFRGKKELFGIKFNPTFGWEEYAGGGVEVREYSSYSQGDILRGSRLRYFAKLLGYALDRAQEEESIEQQ
jgi:thioesterase domain-containing protein/acyl carrier protein